MPVKICVKNSPWHQRALVIQKKKSLDKNPSCAVGFCYTLLQIVVHFMHHLWCIDKGCPTAYLQPLLHSHNVFVGKIPIQCRAVGKSRGDVAFVPHLVLGTSCSTCACLCLLLVLGSFTSCSGKLKAFWDMGHLLLSVAMLRLLKHEIKEH